MFHITTCSLLDFIEMNKRTLSEGSGELASLFKKKKSKELTHNVSCVAKFSKLAISATPKPFQKTEIHLFITLAQNFLPNKVKGRRAEIDMNFP